jgi:hypothetical protein
MARTQAQAMLVILRPLVASTHITKRNTVCRQLNFPSREHAGVSRAHRKSDARLFSARCKSVSRGLHVDSLNVNPNFGAVTYRGLAHLESRYRERPESSAREDRLPRALLSVHFARDRRPAEIARTLRDLPTLLVLAIHRAYLLSFITLHAHASHTHAPAPTLRA